MKNKFLVDNNKENIIRTLEFLKDTGAKLPVSPQLLSHMPLSFLTDTLCVDNGTYLQRGLATRKDYTKKVFQSLFQPAKKATYVRIDYKEVDMYRGGYIYYTGKIISKYGIWYGDKVYTAVSGIGHRHNIYANKMYNLVVLTGPSEELIKQLEDVRHDMIIREVIRGFKE